MDRPRSSVFAAGGGSSRLRSLAHSRRAAAAPSPRRRRTVTGCQDALGPAAVRLPSASRGTRCRVVAEATTVMTAALESAASQSGVYS